MPLFSNPFEHELFFPLVMRVGGVLAVFLVALATLALWKKHKLSEDILLKRLGTWFAIAIILILALLAGSLPFAFLVVAIVLQNLFEYARLVGLPPLYQHVLLATGVVAPIAALVSPDIFYVIAPIFLILATLQPLLTFHKDRESVRHLAFAALGWGYIAWFLAHLVMIHEYVENGTSILLLIFAGVALSDVGAYIVGRTFGKKKLAPNISPNKTRAGALGNFVGAYSGCLLMAFAVPGSAMAPLFLVLPAIIAIGALWGDLVESVLKREFSVKDAGTWLPGFGGLLDRVDSLIICAPLSFYFLRIFG